MTDSFLNKIVVAEFPLGTGTHFEYENLLQNNSIEYATRTRTEYGDAAGFDVISFSVATKDVQKAKELDRLVKNKVYQTHPTNPKYMKIFVLGMIAVALFIATLFILAYYRIIF